MANKRFTFEKLVRDKIPELLRCKGIVVHEKVIEEDDNLIKLKDKLLEEALEVKQAQNGDELQEELADILEVVAALASANGLSMQQIEKKQIEKRMQKGAFEDRIYISHVDIEEDNSIIDFYLKNYAQQPSETH